MKDHLDSLDMVMKELIRLVPIVCFCLCMLHVNGQSPFSPDQTVLLLESKIKSGEKRALRDIGTFLDNPQYKDRILQILQEFTLFKDDEVKLSSELSKQSFLNFYYDHEFNIHFAPFIQAFYVTPLEERRSVHVIKPLPSSSEEDKILALKDYIYLLKSKIQANEKSIEPIIEEIAALELEEGLLFLQETLSKITKTTSSYNPEKRCILALCEALKNLESLESINITLHLLEEKRLTTDQALHYLAYYSNHRYDESKVVKNIKEYYTTLVDSIGDIDSIRKLGYEDEFAFREFFFDDPVDYYGHILSLSEERAWINHNALLSLKHSENPKSLFYISAHLYKCRNKLDLYPINFKSYLDVLENKTGFKIGVLDNQNDIEYQLVENGSTISLRNFMFYWAPFYQEYQWDQDRAAFINKLELNAEFHSYDFLVEQLASTDNTIALDAYHKLAHGDPNRVVKALTENSQIIKSYNHIIPSIEEKYMGQLSKLIQFCKRNKFKIKPYRKLENLLVELKKNHTPSIRHQIENNIINRLTLEDISAVEIWTMLNSKHQEANYSLGRIIKKFYAYNMEEIIKNHDELRLFLKKSFLFDNMNTKGLCSFYLQFLDLEKYTYAKYQLNIMLESEYDEDIINQIYITFNSNELTENLTIKNFIKRPKSFTKDQIKQLKSPDRSVMNSLVLQINKSKDILKIKKFFEYIRLHLGDETMPGLFDLVKRSSGYQNSEKKKYVQKTVLHSLTRYYNHSFNQRSNQEELNKWVSKWDQDQQNYKKWKKDYFNNNKQKLERGEVIQINDLNHITKSSLFTEDDLTLVLGALRKVKPVSDIAKLKFADKLNFNEHISYFKQIPFEYKTLIKVSSFFELKNFEPNMLQYMEEVAASFSNQDKREYYYKLANQQWFNDYISTDKRESISINRIAQFVREEAMLKESELHKKTEATIIYFLLEHKTLNIREKLIAANDMDLKGGMKEQLYSSILARISFNEISDALDFMEYNEPAYFKKYTPIILEDFGIPPIDLKDQNKIEKLHLDLENLSPAGFYQHYLNEMGVQYKTINGDLNIEQVLYILKNENVVPFNLYEGKPRNYYVYSMVKLLENSFDDSLNFHIKLNQNRHNKRQTVLKRAEAWTQFLSQEGIQNGQKITPTTSK